MSKAELASHLESLVCHERPWHILVGSSIGNVGLWRVRGLAWCSSARSAQRAARFSFDGSLHRSAAAYHYLMLHDAQIFSLHMVARRIARLCWNRPILTSWIGSNTCHQPPWIISDFTCFVVVGAQAKPSSHDPWIHCHDASTLAWSFCVALRSNTFLILI